MFRNTVTYRAKIVPRKDKRLQIVLQLNSRFQSEPKLLNQVRQAIRKRKAMNLDKEYITHLLKKAIAQNVEDIGAIASNIVRRVSSIPFISCVTGLCNLWSVFTSFILWNKPKTQAKPALTYMTKSKIWVFSFNASRLWVALWGLPPLRCNERLWSSDHFNTLSAQHKIYNCIFSFKHNLFIRMTTTRLSLLVAIILRSMQV